MKAGPRKGSTAPRPRRSPLRERSAARSTWSSPGSASSTPSTCRSTVGSLALTALIAIRGSLSNKHRPCQAERNARAPALDPDADRAFELALLDDLDPRPGQQAAPLQLAEPVRAVVRHPLDDDLLARATFAEGTLADRANLAGEGRGGGAGGIDLPAAEEVGDPLLPQFRDGVVQP